MDLPYFDKFNQMNFETKIVCIFIDDAKKTIAITINGDMEVQYSKFFIRAMTNLFAREDKIEKIILDFKNVTYVSSSFIASLLHIIQQAKASGKDMFFTNLMNQMEGVVDSLGMGHFVKNIEMEKTENIQIICHNCDRKITVNKLGRVECPTCQTILYISDKGIVN